MENVHTRSWRRPLVSWNVDDSVLDVHNQYIYLSNNMTLRNILRGPKQSGLHQINGYKVHLDNVSANSQSSCIARQISEEGSELVKTLFVQCSHLMYMYNVLSYITYWWQGRSRGCWSSPVITVDWEIFGAKIFRQFNFHVVLVLSLWLLAKNWYRVNFYICM